MSSTEPDSDKKTGDDDIRWYHRALLILGVTFFIFLLIAECALLHTWPEVP